MRILFCILLLFQFTLQGQDKLYFRNGSVKKVILMSVSKDVVYYKSSDSSNVQQAKKEDLLLVEEFGGNRHLFGKAPAKAISTGSAAIESVIKRNNLSVAPLGFLFGRATVAYEHLSENGRIGIVIPFSLTFDPFGVLYDTSIDTTTTVKRIKSVNFIVGGDLNYYPGKIRLSRFFIGPRLRYGTDVFLRNIKGLSLQTQVGWRFGQPDGPFSQHISIGFGFVRILDSPAGRLIDPKRCYGWYSLNYRLGINW